jgi:2'-5' RNA ligase
MVARRPGGVAADRESVRLFVALELPDAVRATLGAWAAGVAAGEDGLRAVTPESLHVTLCFLGMHPRSSVQAIAAACDVLDGAPAPTLALGEALWLPWRRPQVLAVGLSERAPGGALALARATLARRLEATGAFVPERRAFVAHVTVARVRRAAGIRARAVTGAPQALTFEGTRVSLFRSLLGGGPARYECLHSVSLVPS